MDKIMPIIAVLFVLFAGWMSYTVWTLGDDTDDYEVICLGGHEYWRANFAAKGFMAVKLNNNGTPSVCGE